MKNITLFVLCLSIIACNPDTYYVDFSYSGSSDGSQSMPFTTIMDAMKIANPKDTIRVSPGFYKENIIMKEQIYLQSTHTGGAIIHGGADRDAGNPTVITSHNSTIDGFTITGGYDGIVCKGTNPVITRNIVRGNYGDGGIICLDGCKAKVYNNTVLSNLGSGNNITIGIYEENAAPDIQNNIITGNSIGYAPYQSKGVEVYNNIWGNRENYGYNKKAGKGSISKDPMFQKELVDDYSLAKNSPCIDAGNPDNIFYDKDGSRNDMGAFDGMGGYLKDPGFQDYLLESVLQASDTKNGFKTYGTNRFASNPKFYFPPGHRGKAEKFIKPILQRGVHDLSAGKLEAVFLTQAPSAKCEYVEVTFKNPEANFWLKGSNKTDCGYPSIAFLEAGGEIIGGRLVLDNRLMTDTTTYWLVRNAYQTTLHELGHVFGLFHNYRDFYTMSYAFASRPKFLNEGEKAIMKTVFSYPPGTKLEKFITDNVLTRNATFPFPRIDKVHRWYPDSTRWVDAKIDTNYKLTQEYQAQIGDYIFLDGSRLTIKFSNDTESSFRAPNHKDPVLHIGSKEIPIDISRKYQSQTNPKNTWAGGPARYLKVQIPPNTESGWLYVKQRGMQSNAHWIDIIK